MSRWTYVTLRTLLATTLFTHATICSGIRDVSNGALDLRPERHALQHPRGQEALKFLLNSTQVLPALACPPKQWPGKLVVGYAGSYDFKVLKPVIYSFLENADRDSWLVLLVPEGDDPGIPQEFKDRVVVQQHAVASHLDWEDVPYPVSLRFYVVAALLEVIQHQGTVFFIDTRDVFIQRDPFTDYSDGLMHFPRESSSYRIRGPFTFNHDWLLNCYGEETSEAIGGHYVLNSGTLIGPSSMMLAYFRLMLEEMEKRWHCRRQHGSDQAIHNSLVYTGRLIGTGLKFQIEDQTTGQFAFLAYTHPQLYDFRYLSEGREEVYNLGNGKPYVAIHLWPGDNRIAKKVVWPMVDDFEAKRAVRLVGGKLTMHFKERQGSEVEAGKENLAASRE